MSFEELQRMLLGHLSADVWKRSDVIEITQQAGEDGILFLRATIEYAFALAPKDGTGTLNALLPLTLYSLVADAGAEHWEYFVSLVIARGLTHGAIPVFDALDRWVMRHRQEVQYVVRDFMSENWFRAVASRGAVRAGGFQKLVPVGHWRRLIRSADFGERVAAQGSLIEAIARERGLEWWDLEEEWKAAINSGLAPWDRINMLIEFPEGVPESQWDRGSIVSQKFVLDRLDLWLVGVESEQNALK